MSIKVRFFASLSERFGQTESDIEFAQAQTVLDVWRLVTLENAIPENVLTAVNMDYVSHDHNVQEGDEVAFFPPVTGG